MDEERSKSIKELKRKLRELETAGTEGSSIATKVIAGVLLAVISFLSAEMYDFHNQLISINQKMTLLVTPDFKIVPSGKHVTHELAREVIDGRLKALEKESERLSVGIGKVANLGSELRHAHRTECLKHLELLRAEASTLRNAITEDFRRADSVLSNSLEKDLEELEKDLKDMDRRLSGKGSKYW